MVPFTEPHGERQRGRDPQPDEERFVGADRQPVPGHLADAVGVSGYHQVTLAVPLAITDADPQPNALRDAE